MDRENEKLSSKKSPGNDSKKVQQNLPSPTAIRYSQFAVEGNDLIETTPKAFEEVDFTGGGISYLEIIKPLNLSRSFDSATVGSVEDGNRGDTSAGNARKYSSRNCSDSSNSSYATPDSGSMPGAVSTCADESNPSTVSMPLPSSKHNKKSTTPQPPRTPGSTKKRSKSLGGEGTKNNFGTSSEKMINKWGSFIGKKGHRPRLDSGSSAVGRSPLLVNSQKNSSTLISNEISGYLSKLAAGNVWQNRWFETNGKYLTYYKTRSKKECLAVLNLTKSGRIYVDIEDGEMRTFIIEVKNKPYRCVAASEAECADWVIMLNRIKDERSETMTRSLTTKVGIVAKNLELTPTRSRSKTFRPADNTPICPSRNVVNFEEGGIHKTPSNISGMTEDDDNHLGEGNNGIDGENVDKTPLAFWLKRRRTKMAGLHSLGCCHKSRKSDVVDFVDENKHHNNVRVAGGLIRNSPTSSPYKNKAKWWRSAEGQLVDIIAERAREEFVDDDQEFRSIRKKNTADSVELEFEDEEVEDNEGDIDEDSRESRIDKGGCDPLNTSLVV